MVNGTSLAVEQSTFMNNTAGTGGAIYMSRITDTYIYDTYFYSNNVTQEGGAIYSGTHFPISKTHNVRFCVDPPQIGVSFCVRTHYMPTTSQYCSTKRLCLPRSQFLRSVYQLHATSHTVCSDKCSLHRMLFTQMKAMRSTGQCQWQCTALRLLLLPLSLNTHALPFTLWRLMCM